jgi:hypothetical protein
LSGRACAPFSGQELSLPNCDRAVAEDWLDKWAMNLMLIKVSTRLFRRAARLREGDVPAPAGAGVSKVGCYVGDPIGVRSMLVTALENEFDRFVAAC